MILDAGVFIMAENRPARLVALLERLIDHEDFRTNHAVMGQVWRNPAGQVRLRRFLAEFEVEVDPLDDGEAVGVLLARAGSSDVVDAGVALMALSAGQVVLTSNPDDIAGFGATCVDLS